MSDELFFLVCFGGRLQGGARVSGECTGVVDVRCALAQPTHSACLLVQFLRAGLRPGDSHLPPVARFKSLLPTVGR